ncbi:GntR family transcriptional regulator [Arsenicitalea aurantiaca]|uniref:GntR family transcriptional regulator n=1 Tax=Arsenicitalea aurantiaca TaxID=1783274 RepID=A0A433X472_9HYPH|nr:GntR family transcriptional regulator [Arsenicitalea aurantiaca]RUT28865.1 GntR family transcriptional regulator [Arsenicitalea aurantiaca]
MSVITPERTETPSAAPRGQLHIQTVGRLREMIMNGVLPPGARLREVQLCGALGVSRTPVREALRTLAAEGLVDLLPNKSVVVARLRAPDIVHLYRVFGALEGLAGELACARVTADEIAEIGRLLSEMVDLHAKADRTGYMAINHAIHRRVVEISANPILEAQWRTLLPRVERARALANLDRDRWSAALFEHSKMFAALAGRDGPLLNRLTREHFLNGLPSTTAQAERAAEGPTG